MDRTSGSGGVDLFWLPLGAGGHCVRLNGRVFEAVAARRARRTVCDLYHSALEVRLDDSRWVVEMAPVWNLATPDRGVVCEGPVALASLGRFRLFRYEVRCWLEGCIPDLAEAVGGPLRVSTDPLRARSVLEPAPAFPTYTWGADEQHTGEMWNSNSLIAWLLARSGHDMDRIAPPPRGRAPGWSAGLVLAARDQSAAS